MTSSHPPGDVPARSAYYPSFALSEKFEAREHYKKEGFVVFKEIFSDVECQQSKSDMWEVVEQLNPGLSRGAPETWGLYKASGKYGLSSKGPVFTRQLVDNRQNVKLAKALSTVLEHDIEDLLVSQDRFTIYRATELDGDGAQFATGKKNIHLDLNPWWYLEDNIDVLVGANSLSYKDSRDFVKENNLVIRSISPHVQCILNFEDNNESDGGTIVVPGLHYYLEDWCANHESLRRNVPFLTFRDEEKYVEEELLEKAIRVPMAAGSILIWDQRLWHGTQPNASKNCRFAQFLKAFSRRQTFEVAATHPDLQMQPVHDGNNSDIKWIYDGQARLRRRAEALKGLLNKHGCLDVVSGVGNRLFGLDVLK